MTPLDAAPVLEHPGEAADERLVVVPARLRSHEVELPAGARLLEALGALLDEIGASSAVGELHGGELAAFSYFVPDVGAPGGPVADFSAPRTCRGPARLVRGGLTLGLRDGAVFSHSHARFVDAEGVEAAGHLVPDSVVLGPGVTARVWADPEVVIEVQADPETTMNLFVPRRTSVREAPDGVPTGPTGPTGGAAGARSAVVCRVRPNVDLVGAVERIVDEQGWASAEVVGQIGSLVGGRLRGPDGTTIEVDGPATEVMTIEGTVEREAGRTTARLVATLVDRHGRVHTGGLLPGLNPVAMTFELALVAGGRTA
ncbi:MAG: DUF296 domain-containing protein [Nocardioides alkalitolerans]